jgi:hypothetical protein
LKSRRMWVSSKLMSVLSDKKAALSNFVILIRDECNFNCNRYNILEVSNNVIVYNAKSG